MYHTKINNKFNNIIKYRTLCINIIHNKTCSYANNCIYAHSLSEQCIDNNKKMVLELLKFNNLEEINLIKNKELYNNLLILTKLCNKCIIGVCPGGYNCKYGSCSVDNLICNEDLHTGTCPNSDKCTKGIHLTAQGLIPYNVQLNKYDMINIDANKTIKSKRILYQHIDVNKPYMYTNDYYYDSDTNLDS